MRLLLVRHGQSTNNVLAEELPYEEYIASRSAEPELTPAGCEQAERLAHFFGDVQSAPAESWQHSHVTERPVTALYTSPMLRALKTTAPLARALGLDPKIWVDIHEHGGLFTGSPRTGTVVNYGGLSRAAMAAQFPGYAVPDGVSERGWWFGGYEEMAQCTARAQRVAQTVRGWVEERKDEVIMLVSHGTFMDQFLKALLGAGESPTFYFSHINTAISRVDFLESGFAAVRYLNRAPHLPPDLYTR